MEAAMRKVPIWLLLIAGLIGLVMALGSFQGRGGGREIQGDGGIVERVREERMIRRMGYPDTWLEWESRPNAHIVGVYFLSWSFGILVASVCALCGVLVPSRRTPPQGRVDPTVAGDRPRS
jgi:hypothetical protein